MEVDLTEEIIKTFVEEKRAFVCPSCGKTFSDISYAPNGILCPDCPPAAHAAEQPKLTEAQVREALLTCVRDISKLQELLREKHGKGFTIPCSTGKLRAANVLHLLTSPVAPPPHVTVSTGAPAGVAPPSWAKPKWDEGAFHRAQLAESFVPDYDEPPVAPGEQPPRNPYENAICNHQDRNNPNHVHTHACPQDQPPAQELASDEVQRLRAFINEMYETSMVDRPEKLAKEIAATAAKQAREGALEEAAKIADGEFVSYHDAANKIRALAAQPSPQTKETK